MMHTTKRVRDGVSLALYTSICSLFLITPSLGEQHPFFLDPASEARCWKGIRIYVLWRIKGREEERRQRNDNGREREGDGERGREIDWQAETVQLKRTNEPTNRIGRRENIAAVIPVDNSETVRAHGFIFLYVCVLFFVPLVRRRCRESPDAALSLVVLVMVVARSRSQWRSGARESDRPRDIIEYSIHTAAFLRGSYRCANTDTNSSTATVPVPVAADSTQYPITAYRTVRERTMRTESRPPTHYEHGLHKTAIMDNEVRSGSCSRASQSLYTQRSNKPLHWVLPSARLVLHSYFIGYKLSRDDSHFKECFAKCIDSTGSIIFTTIYWQFRNNWNIWTLTVAR